MNIFSGRPSEIDAREDREIRVYDMLDSLFVEYERCDHAPALTMEDCEAVDEAMGVRMCKNLFLCNRQKTDFYLLLIPADKPFKTKELSAQLGVSRLSFASAEDMERLLDIRPGAVSVLGLMNDKEREVRLLVDEDLLSCEYFGAHPCVNTSSLKFKTSDLFEKVLPAVKHDKTIVKLSCEM
jgi:Ala-tRNA(Pro) deacylase